MTRYFYDTEFLENGETIDLLSIGIVADDGREFYGVNAWADWERAYADKWLRENVLSSIPTMELRRAVRRPVGPDVTLNLAEEVRDFLLAGDTPPQLWAWYAAYDHVALCQLWGRMIDLPEGIPMFTNDLKSIQHLFAPRLVLPEQQGTEHNALEDARHLRDNYARVFSAIENGMI